VDIKKRAARPWQASQNNMNIVAVSPQKIQAVIDSPNSGFLLINKPLGEPSFRTISQLRRITGQKKIGFAGTLDPAASGLLVIGVNEATKLLDLWHGFKKEYEAEVTVGQVSTTYDSEGEIQPPLNPSLIKEGLPAGRQGKTRRVEAFEVSDALQKFIGAIEQLPPMYSVKSVGGQRLYTLARQGKEIERPLQKITIYSIDIIDYHYPILKIKVVCSTGTYIRSLAHDLGQALGHGAYLSGLQRTAIGPYRLALAIPVSAITADNWQQKFIAQEGWLQSLKTQNLSPTTADQI